jgi:class 3 adenylate cyclase
MIPGRRINVVFMICKVHRYIDYTEVLGPHMPIFLNNIVSILHECAGRWDGQANTLEGDRYMITWKLPDTEKETDPEKQEELQELKTELADKSLIAAVKIVSELRRAAPKFLNIYSNEVVQEEFGSTTSPYITFGLHMGYTIEGTIGSDFKIDACYLSANVEVAYRIEELCDYY